MANQLKVGEVIKFKGTEFLCTSIKQSTSERLMDMEYEEYERMYLTNSQWNILLPGVVKAEKFEKGDIAKIEEHAAFFLGPTPLHLTIHLKLELTVIIRKEQENKNVLLPDSSGHGTGVLQTEQVADGDSPVVPEKPGVPSVL